MESQTCAVGGWGPMFGTKSQINTFFLTPSLMQVWSWLWEGRLKNMTFGSILSLSLFLHWVWDVVLSLKKLAWRKGPWKWNQIMYDVKSTFTLKLSPSYAREQHNCNIYDESTTSQKTKRTWTMTNMSSMPMPRQRKGNIECIGVYGKPRSELNIS